MAALHQHDIARVSRAQIEALGRLFKRMKEPQSRGDTDRRVRVAVVHHQLLPVSTTEERKTFEALINLGLVREALRAYDVDVVLHGHKHVDGLYWDGSSAPGVDLATPARRMLVVSAPGAFAENQPVLRILRLEDAQTAPSLVVRTGLGCGAQQHSLQFAQQAPRVPLWLSAMSQESLQPDVIRAPEAHTAYSRLQALRHLGDADRELRNLLCQVDGPTNADVLPPDYPDMASATAQDWMDEMIEWWQLKKSRLVEEEVVLFNHGNRIFSRYGNQVERAARLLDQRPTSSRAVVQLIDPSETGRYDKDRRELSRGPYPAFASAQFSLVERGNGTELDCFAVFRKQELRYWWPVNFGELARLQRDVNQRLEDPTVELGRIVTFSAVAHWKDTLPRVAVPEVDRLVDDPERLWDLAASVFRPGSATPSARSDWTRVLDDLEGKNRTEPARPSLGLTELISEMKRIRRLDGIDKARAVERQLEDLQRLLAAQTGPSLNPHARALIRDQVGRLRRSVTKALRANGES